MNSYSFLVECTDATDHDMTVVFEKLKSMQAETLTAQVEIIFYGYPRDQTTPSKLIKIVVVPSNSNVNSLQQAIVTSAGDWIVFTTTENFLRQSEIIDKDVELNGAEVCLLPIKLNISQKKLGIRSLEYVPYVAFKKAYIISLVSKCDTLLACIKATDKDLKLHFIDSHAAFTHPVIRNTTFIRPYFKIIQNIFRHFVQLIHGYFEQRRKERLRKRVLPVIYIKTIPVFIICRDRVEPLKKLVTWLETEGLKNIYFIDNDSTYRPLLDYYVKSPYNVIQLNVNAGHIAPWSQGIVQLYAKGMPFIVTDPDVVPEKAAHGAVKFFVRLLNDHPERTKVGFGLRIDNLPDNYDLKKHVVAWEKRYWTTEMEPDVYDAEIDTTFALYRPNTSYVLGPGIRTGGRYVARHEPWYIDSKNPDEELRYYREHANKIINSWGISEDDATETYLGNLSNR